MTSFGDDIAEVLVELRELALDRMRDECVIERPVGRNASTDATPRQKQTYELVWEGQCRIGRGGYSDSAANVGDQRIAVGTVPVHLPWDLPAVAQNYRIRITAIGPNTAPRHLGNAYFIGTDHDQSDQTATRLIVKEDPWPST